MHAPKFTATKGIFSPMGTPKREKTQFFEISATVSTGAKTLFVKIRLFSSN